MLFEGPYSGSWRPTWPEKPPKGAREGEDIGGDIPPVFGLGGVLGGLGASWGPRADFNRFLVDF